MLEAPTESPNGGTFRIDEERPSPTVVVLVLHGEADLHSAPELRDRLRTVLDSGVSGLIVDLAGASFVDSTSLGVLLGGLKRQREDGHELHIVVSKPEIRRIFEITLLDQVFPLHDTRADALASLSAEAR